MPTVALKTLASAVLLCASAQVAAASRAPAAPDFGPVRIAYERHILPNGLTLIIHEDRKAPIVAVNVWYHVGSKDERPGRTGFAHLFEHLMFNGSEHYNDEYFRALEPAGATKMNGTTWYDRTNYYQNVPTSALDRALWLESDRMGHLLGVIDQARLDEQRNVVLNEKRQGDNQPYGKVDDVLAAATYPAGHPYSWTTIGSEADLKAASLDDVKAWFREYYGAANATLVVAGDVDAAEVKRKVEHYFGDIPAGPPLRRHGAWVAKLQGEKRATMQDRVPQTMLVQSWNIPGFCERDANLLSIAATVLGDGKNSRLYRRLVYRDQIATSVDTSLPPLEIASQFRITAMVKPGGDARAVERAIDEELQRFLREGPTAEELGRVRTSAFASALRGLERIDGGGGKSAQLAQYQVYCGSPDRYSEELEEIRRATVAQVREVAQRWLSDGVFKLEVQPFPEHQTASRGADRSALPELGSSPPLKLPTLQRGTLSNGLQLVLAERHDAPIVQFSLIADAGYAADAGGKAGTARLALDMLDEGAGSYDALQFAEAAEALGAKLGAGSSLDTSVVSLNALKARLVPSLALYADMLLQPRFPEHELQRLKQQQLATIRQEKAQPSSLARRLYTRLLYGETHAYANPLSGTGTEASVPMVSVDDVRAFHRRWLRPDTSTLLIVGDTTLAEITPLLEQTLGRWRAPAEAAPQKALSTVSARTSPQLVLVNKSDAEQSLILAAALAPPKSDPDDLAMQLVSTALGGNFVSRLNMNLREDKHWSYGAFASIGGAKAQRPFLAYAPVQTDKTAESLSELERELREAIGKRRFDARELDFARDSLVRALPGDNETAAEVAGSYATVLSYGLPDDYWNRYVGEVQQLAPDRVNAAAARLIRPESLSWIVIGDLSRIEQPLRAQAAKLGIREIRVLDADGQVLR